MTIPIARLHDAVDHGIITDEQLAAILNDGAGTDAVGREPSAESRERRSPLSAPTIAYWAGAIAVLFAFGWFLVDRWRVLGAGGVLVVSLVYAGLFAVSARMLLRHGFRLAGSLATLLVVGMTPIVGWALLSLAGLWPEPDLTPERVGPRTASILEGLRWLPIDVATIGVALAALRLVRTHLLALPIAVALWAVAMHLAPLVLDAGVAGETQPYVLLVLATVLLAIGYLVSLRQEPGEDYAEWFFLVGLVAGAMAAGGIWSQHRRVAPHAIAAVSVLLGVVSLYLRRPVFIVFATIGFISYLAYLAFDLFRDALSFPVVLASFGITVIVLTVVVQRRYPALARRLDDARGGRRPALPGGWLGPVGAIVVALALLGAEGPAARERMTDRAWHMRQMARRGMLRPTHAPPVRPRGQPRPRA